MFSVIRVRSADNKDDGREVIGVAETRENAIAIIDGELARFTTAGKNEQHDYWWGRNDDGFLYRFFVEGV
ncbi:MAG: hypothetical protein JNL25_00750 [Rhodospirillaceae bacterium]|nr:hypothetical protein [Rhodospirillaceae bacterium]